MDWPNRTLKSRFVWLVRRLTSWRVQHRTAGCSPLAQPPWWEEFERAFSVYARAQVHEAAAADEARARKPRTG